MDGQAGKLAQGTRSRRPGRRHHRLLLWRPRLRHAAQQALALQLRPARAASSSTSRRSSATSRSRTTSPAATSDRMVAFVDLAPTLLSLAGIQPPAHLQGSAFLGRTPRPRARVQLRLPRPHGRALRHGAHRARPALRLHPQLHAAQDLRAAHRLHVRDARPRRCGRSSTTKASSSRRRPTSGRPSRPRSSTTSKTIATKSNNLAKSPEHKATLERLRKAQQDLAVKIRDVGFLPEGEIHSRSKGTLALRDGARRRALPDGEDHGHGGAGLVARQAATPELVKRLDGPRQRRALLGRAWAC